MSFLIRKVRLGKLDSPLTIPNRRVSSVLPSISRTVLANGPIHVTCGDVSNPRERIAKQRAVMKAAKSVFSLDWTK